MVDAIAAMIAEAVAARAKETQARAAAVRPGAPRPAATARPTAAPAAPAAPPAPRPPRASVQFQPIPDPASPVVSGLLSAFGSSDSLLAGIVLSEALSPPIALRRDEPRF